MASRGDVYNQMGSPPRVYRIIKSLNQEIRKLSAFNPFQDRQTDIVAYRGAMCNQKGFSLVHWKVVCQNLHQVLTQ